MKLLTPKQIKSEKRKELHKEVILADKVKTVTEARRRELNQIKSSYVTEREVMDMEHAKFITTQRKEKATLGNEIANLNAEKKQAMKPVTALMEDVERDKALLTVHLADVSEEGKRQDVRDALLSRREKELVDKGVSLRDMHIALGVREGDIQEKEKEIALKDSNLSKTTHEQTEKFNTQNAELVEEKKVFEDEKKALAREKKTLDTREAGLDIKEVQLADKRATLERAFKRIKN